MGKVNITQNTQYPLCKICIRPYSRLKDNSIYYIQYILVMSPTRAKEFSARLGLITTTYSFLVEFHELSHLTHDLSQAVKTITVVTSRATDKMTIIFTQNDTFDHFE